MPSEFEKLLDATLLHHIKFAVKNSEILGRIQRLRDYEYIQYLNCCYEEIFLHQKIGSMHSINFAL